MKRIISCTLLIFIMVFISGCEYEKNEPVKENQLVTEEGYEEPVITDGVFVSRNPSPGEILKENPGADIFLYKDIVAINAKNIDWVMELKINEEEAIGEILYKYKKGEKFKQAMATKLPVGSKIYKVKERSEVLLAEVNGKYLRYLLIIEG